MNACDSTFVTEHCDTLLQLHIEHTMERLKRKLSIWNVIQCWNKTVILFLVDRRKLHKINKKNKSKATEFYVPNRGSFAHKILKLTPCDCPFWQKNVHHIQAVKLGNFKILGLIYMLAVVNRSCVLHTMKCHFGGAAIK